MADSTCKVLKIVKMAKQWGLDWFILALIGVILLAYFWPHIGAEDSVIPFTQIATYGISVVFFFYGLKLSPQKVRTGLSNWRLHLVVQLATFVLFPLLVLLAKNILGINVREVIWIGVFFLASLPGTVSSAVVMVSIAKGNIPSAIFNASISTLIGVFITPLWMEIYLNTASVDIDLGPILLKLTLQVIFPVILGIILNPLWGAFAEKNSKRLRYFDQTIVLLIVYTAFCESFAKKMFEGYSVLLLVELGVAMIVLFYAVYVVIYLTSKILKFRHEDKITALFCGSKKSLVHGTVMSKVLFAGSPYIGIVLLPIMMYHALQLVMVSVIAQWFARNNVRANS